MPIIFSKSCEYGLQATLFIAKKENGTPIHLREISKALHIPHHFLSKILQTLARHEIVHSHKGQNGGFELGRQASNITLNDIVKAIDGEAFLAHCVLGFPECSDDRPCPVHAYWKEAKKIVLTMLCERTIDDLSQSIDVKLLQPKSLSQRRTTSPQINNNTSTTV